VNRAREQADAAFQLPFGDCAAIGF
jgi:hypothetical protein